MIWQSRPLFVSSTFADMQAERDHLRTHVFPALEEKLKVRRRHLEWVDLRLGVATAGEADAAACELQVLKVCLAEVRRCRPFLIVLLGDRYGWVPPAERITSAAAEEGFAADVMGRSVTDLEIRYGVLANPGQQPRSYFYFRESLPYDDMPREVAALYSDAHGPGGRGSAGRLAELKAEIERALPQRMRCYSVAWDRQSRKVTGLEAWGQMVLEDIWSDLEATASDEAREPLSWQEAERLALNDYIEDRARDFVGRSRILARLEGLAQSAAQEGAAWGLVLTGGAGAGKSATFGELYRHLRRSGAFVPAHAAGASPRAPSVDDMLRRWIEELGSAIGTDTGLADNADPDTIEATFQSLLGRMAAGRRVVVLIDALDQFEATTRGQFMTWLPRLWPENARLIATAIPGEASKALAGRTGVETIPLPALDAAEARRIAEGICARYHRTLEHEVLDALLTKRGADGPAWGNSLWLVLAVEELNLVDADDFARAQRVYKGSGAERLRALMLDIVAALPTDIVGLYGATFDRAEELHGREFARAFLGAIAVSRSGWRESDFRVLLPRLARPADRPRPGLLSRLFRSRQPEAQPAGEAWDELRFASLRRLFRGQVRQRGRLGQWDFNHTQMRAAARQRLAAHSIPEPSFHVAAAYHLLALPSDDPLRVTETMLHLMGSEDWPGAAHFYGDPSLTEAEIEGATRVLADAVLTARPDGRAGAVRRVRRVVDAATPSTDAESQAMGATVAHRVLFSLHTALEERGDLESRAHLIAAASEILRVLVAAVSGNAGWQRDLSISYGRIGDILRAQGNLPPALASYQSALQISDQLIESDPGYAEWQRVHSVTQQRMADVLRAQGNLAAAITQYEASRAISDRLAKSDPENARLQRDLVISHIRIGLTLEGLGNLAEALASYQNALAISNRLAKSDPENAEWQNVLGISNERIGGLLAQYGDLSEALKYYQAKNAVMERLTKADPANVIWQRGLSVSGVKIGDVFLEQGKLAQALASYQAALAINDRLTKADPKNAEWQRDLSVAQIKIGDVLLEQRKLAQALASYQAALATRDRLAKADPGNAGWQRDLSVAQTKVGDILFEQGNLPAALRRYEVSLAISDRLAKADPANAKWQRELSLSQEKIGEVLQGQGKLAQALTKYQSALKISDRLAKSDPENAGWLGDLASSYGKIGLVLEAMGRRAEALTILRKGREITRPLAARAPDHKLWHNYLERLDRDIARLERRAAD